MKQVGFGWDGQFTRERWREVCLEYLLKGKDEFLAWQDSWEQKVDLSLPDVSFECKLIYEDGTHENVLQYANEPCSLDFSGSIFKSWLHCKEFKFKKSVLFAGTRFYGDVIFDTVYFGIKADFEKTTFNGGAYFDNSTFIGDAFFGNITIRNSAYFNRVVFNGDVYFENAVFEDISLFEGITVSGEAYFESTFYNGFTVFENSIFNTYADFEGSIFCQLALFNRVTFKEDANYRGTTFAGDANFFKAKFLNQCRFDNEQDEEVKNWSNETRFFGAVNFENTEIQNVGHFERVQFNGEVPNFLGVDNAKTLLIFSGDEYFNKNDITEDSVKRLGQLKRLADEQGQTDQALMFNAFELNAKSKQSSVDFYFKWFTKFYSLTSNYGRSFVRPLGLYLILLLTIFLIALGNAAYHSPKDCKAENLKVLSDLLRDDSPCDISPTKPDDKMRLNGYRAAAEYTIYRAAVIFDFSDNGKATDVIARRLFAQSYEPGWMRALTAIAAIVSSILLFLIGLGIRNKYRIK